VLLLSFRIQQSFYSQHTGRMLIRNVSKFIQEACAIQTAQHLLRNVRKFLRDFTASRIIRWQFFTVTIFHFLYGFQSFLRFFTDLSRANRWTPILSQPKPVHTLTLYYLHIHIIIIIACYYSVQIFYLPVCYPKR
jgi:hypothetical protein